MDSIDRLRDWLKGRLLMGNGWNELNEIADAIEREVGEMRDFCKRLREAVKFKEDVTLWGVDYTALPLDADGVPIHVGDVMEWPDCSTAEVVGIGDGTFFYVEDGEDAADWSCASDKIHHHAPTVEDVLREFTDAVLEWAGKSGTVAEVGTWSDVAAKYAAKLRLAGDE